MVAQVRKSHPTLTKMADIVFILRGIANRRQEYFVCLSLDSAYRLIRKRTVFIGTLTSVIAHPREVFAGPMTDRAGAIIVAHNHPSGDVTPSKQDIGMTQQLIAAGLILGIPLSDHIIVAKEKHFSFRENGLIGPESIAKGAA